VCLLGMGVDMGRGRWQGLTGPLSGAAADAVTGAVGGAPIAIDRSGGAFPRHVTRVDNVFRRPADITSWAWLWLVDTRKCPCIAAPLGRYYMYYATDHEARSGVRVAYSDSMDGPWVQYRGGLAVGDATIIYEDLDISTGRPAALSTETPSVIYDETAGALRMFYHCINPAYGVGTGSIPNASDPGGARSGCTPYLASQGTMSATSTDGLTWSKDRNFRLDVYWWNQGHGAGDHTGYFVPSKINGGWVAYHLLGGTDSAAQAVSYCPDGDTGKWFTDARQISRYADIVADAGYPECFINWNNASVVPTTTGHSLLCSISTPASNIAVPVARHFVSFPISSDGRTILGPPKLIDADAACPIGFVESDDGGYIGVFRDGAEMGYYHVK
jgi:hypothetical protein